MSVLIKGMELPTGCKFCAMMRYYPSNGNVWCNATNRRMQYKDSVLSTRQEFCPLVEVKTSHGRLIDADAFDERVRVAGGMSEEELTEDFKDGVQTVLYMLSKQPTIIEAEGSVNEQN